MRLPVPRLIGLECRLLDASQRVAAGELAPHEVAELLADLADDIAHLRTAAVAHETITTRKGGKHNGR